MEGENGDGEFNLWLEVKPSAIIGGDPLTLMPSVLALHQINPALLDAAGDGEGYPFLIDGNIISYDLKIRANSPEARKIGIYLHGFEDDPIWDDGLYSLNRAFHEEFTVWDPENQYPSWAPGCVPNWTANCYYGRELAWGLVRGPTTGRVPYEDFLGENPCAFLGQICWTHALKYTLEEIPLP
jgi:hypothetical protein